MQQIESFVFVERSSSSLYTFWTKKQDFIDDKHLKTLKQINRENAKNERLSFKKWFETLSQMREHEMKMRMKDNFANVLNRMMFKSITSTFCYSWSQSTYQSSYSFSFSSSFSSEYSSSFSWCASSYFYSYSYLSFSSSSQQSSFK